MVYPLQVEWDGGLGRAGAEGGWPNIIKKANSLLLFVDIIYIFTKIIREGFVPSLKGGGQIEEIIK